MHLFLTSVCTYVNDLQVVVNPFVWERLQKPGQAIPFMFEQFKPKALPQARQSDLQQTQQSLPVSRQQVLQLISQLIQQLLGFHVSAISLSL